MTREEALEWFKDRKEMYLLDDKCQQAEDMAIKALEQEPCDDAISRQAAIDGLNSINGTSELDKAFEVIENLPPVNPQPKTGHWIEKDVVLQEDNAIDEWQSARCDKCGKYHTTPYMYYFSHYEYCPNCGAKMVGPQESEGKR